MGSTYHSTSYHTIPYHTTTYHTILPHTIPYHTIPYHTIPPHTIPSFQTCHRVAGVIIHHKPLKLYILADCLINKILSQINQYCIHHNGMASERQRKQDICVLAVSHEQCKTLFIEKVGTLAQLLPKASMHSSNRTTLRHAIKNLALRISTCLPLSRWVCQLVLWGISI